MQQLKFTSAIPRNTANRDDTFVHEDVVRAEVQDLDDRTIVQFAWGPEEGAFLPETITDVELRGHRAKSWEVLHRRRSRGAVEHITMALRFPLVPAEILEEARSWGAMHGQAYAHNREIYEAVRVGEEVDWLDDPDMLWDGIGVDLEDELPRLPEDFRLEAEQVAREAAQEAGMKLAASLTPDEVG